MQLSTGLIQDPTSSTRLAIYFKIKKIKIWCLLQHNANDRDIDSFIIPLEARPRFVFGKGGTEFAYPRAQSASSHSEALEI